MADEKVVKVKVVFEGDSTKAKEAATKVGNATKEVKKSQKESIESFGIMDTKIGKTAKGVLDFGKKGVSAMSSLKGAIISSGIGVLVIAVVSLISYFTKTERGVQQLHKVMAALGAIVSTVVDTFIKIGETLAKVGGLILKVVTGQKSLGDAWKEGKEIAKDAIGDIKDQYTGLNEKIKESIALAERENQLKVARRNFLVDEAKMEVALSEARLKTNDATLTAAQRLEALNEATKINNDIYEKKIAQAREEYEIQKKKNSLSETTSDDLEKEAQLQADLIRLEAQRNQSNKEFSDQRSALLKAEADKRQKEADDKKKAAKDETKKQLEEQQKQQKQLEEHQNALALLKLKGQEQELEALNQWYEAQQLALADNEEALLVLDEEFKLKQQQTEEKYRKQKEEAEKEARDKKEEADKAAHDAEMKRLEDEAKEREDNKNKALSSASDSLKKFSEIAGKQSQAGKAFAIAATLIDTYQSAIAAFKSLAGIPIVGPALGAVAAAAAVAMGLKNVAEIRKTEPAKQLGGPILGNSHPDGGVNVNAEGGEYVVNKNSMSNPQIASQVAALNAAGLGGGPVPQLLTEERVAQIAAQVVKSVPVTVDTETSNKIGIQDRKVQQRESIMSY